jgi:hypothetical protein
MRLIIAGSRSIPVGVSMLIIDAALRVHDWHPSEVISGMAPGPDTAGATWARARGITVRPFWAQWAVLGAGAGPERNERMARVGTHLLALWDSQSTGTADMLERARSRGLRVIQLKVVASPATAARMEAERKERRRRAPSARRTSGKLAA